MRVLKSGERGDLRRIQCDVAPSEISGAGD